MQQNFSQIIEEVLTQMGKTTDSVESTILDSIKLRINQIQSKIYFSDSWEWRKQRFYFSTRAEIDTGTVSVTKNSRSVTLSSAVGSDIMKYASLVINDKIFKIDPHTAITTTTFSLAAPYSGETDATATYKIIFPDYVLDPEITAIVSVFSENRELDVRHQSRLTSNHIVSGRPREATVIGRTDFDFLTGTDAVVTQGSKTVTSAAGNFTSDMVGMPFKTDEFSELYTIHSVDSSTQITLRQAYNGDTGSGKSFKVAPKGSLLLRFVPFPDDVYFVEVEALRGPRLLINNTDESDIPNHDPLISGAIWLALRDMDNRPITQVQQAKLTFKEDLRELKDTFRIVKNIKWATEGEIQSRQTSIDDFFRPLDSNIRGPFA